MAALIAGLVAVAPNAHAASLQDFKHIVVIYQENHSFDNLYGQWGDVDEDAINGPQNATPARTKQVKQDNVTLYQCLLQNDVNLTSPPLAQSCTDSVGTTSFKSAFKNQPFFIDNYIAATDSTCPAPGVFAANGVLKGSAGALPGGCTKDIVHRFYSEQYQLNGGKQNRYLTGSDASGLTMGAYDSKKLPIFKYLHERGAPKYVIADSFFQSAFGGSFLNHQWLVAGASPFWMNAVHDGTANDFHSVLDSNGMPTATPLYTPTGTVKDTMMTQACPNGSTNGIAPNGFACGDYAVNTTQPFSQPYSPGTATNRRLPPLINPTIGDRLMAKNVDWAWYSGGWSNASGNIGGPGWTNGTSSCTDPNANAAAGFPLCPDKNFQFHHQAFNYYANFQIGTVGRTHLRDEAEFIQAAHNGTLKPVSFIKPVGEENEHPGYTSETEGSSHLVDLITAVVNGPQAKDTLIIVTYDEFGGQWDHVPPPPHGRSGRDAQAADQWGPGTRIPALLVSKRFDRSGVAHEDFDTTSIIKLIERRFDLQTALTRPVRSLSVALRAAGDDDRHDHDDNHDHDNGHGHGDNGRD